MENAEARQQHLDHILRAAAAIERLTQGKSLADYLADPDTAAAVERYLERMVIAARHLPAKLREEGARISWTPLLQVMEDLRHASSPEPAHRVFEIVCDDLPAWKAGVLALLDDAHRHGS